MDNRWKDKGFRNDDTHITGVDAPDPPKSDAGLPEPLAYYPYPLKIKDATPDVDGACWETSEVERIRAQKRFKEDSD
jgi:hypothetical protein